MMLADLLASNFDAIAPTISCWSRSRADGSLHLLPNIVKDNGTAAVVDFALAEWHVMPFFRPEPAAMLMLIYADGVGWERMGVDLDRALSKIMDDTPRHAGVLRAQLRRAAEVDFEKGGSGTDAYVALAQDYYEVADAFPTGNNINGIYDWSPTLPWPLCRPPGV